MKERVPSAKIIGKVSHRFAEITSTNNYAKQLIANGEPVHGTAILADQQVGGRGQAGKYWQTAPGKNLLCSIILKPEAVKIDDQFFLNKAIALAVCDTVEFFAQQEAQIKWPNDILVEETKISGILIENFLQQNLLHYSVVGVGLNVNQLIFSGDFKATSLQLITGIDYDLQQLTQAFFNYFESRYHQFIHLKFTQIDEAYHAKLFRYDAPQVFKKDGHQFIGTIKGVSALGLLKVEVNGQMQYFRNQEVEFVM